MKEIKFRVWLHNIGYMETAHFDNGKWVSTDGVFSMKVGENDFIEQYTGLKDKNGKEIYEGDIVRQFGSNLICPVEFKYGGFVPFTSDMMTFYDDYCEVIGNIHENGDLLGGK